MKENFLFGRMSERLDSPRKCITFDVNVRIYICVKAMEKIWLTQQDVCHNFRLEEDKY